MNTKYSGNVGAVAGRDIINFNINQPAQEAPKNTKIITAQKKKIETLITEIAMHRWKTQAEILDILSLKFCFESIDTIEQDKFTDIAQYLEHKKKALIIARRITGNRIWQTHKLAIENFSRTRFASAYLKDLSLDQITQVEAFTLGLHSIEEITPEEAKESAKELMKAEEPIADLSDKVKQEFEQAAAFRQGMGFDANRLDREALYPLILCGKLTPKQIRMLWKELILTRQDNKLKASLNVFQVLAPAIMITCSLLLALLGFLVTLYGGQKILIGMFIIGISGVFTYLSVLSALPIFFYFRIKPILKSLENEVDKEQVLTMLEAAKPTKNQTRH